MTAFLDGPASESNISMQGLKVECYIECAAFCVASLKINDSP